MATNEPFEQLSEDQALELMATKTFGRIVVRRSDEIDIFPINYVVNDGKLYIRTAEGTKLFSLKLNPDVVLESDEVDLAAQQAWSVIVKGEARVLTDHHELVAAEDLPLKPWLPTLKYNFVEITPRSVSGRKFHLGDEPERF